MNASSLSGLWAMVIFMGSGRKAPMHSPAQHAEVLEGHRAEDERRPRPLPGPQPLAEEQEGQDEGDDHLERAQDGGARRADEGHAGEEGGHGHDRRDDADAGHGEQARGSRGRASPPPARAKATQTTAAACARWSARTRAGTPAPKRLLSTM